MGSDDFKIVLPNSRKHLVATNLAEGMKISIPEIGVEISLIDKYGKSVRMVFISENYEIHLEKEKIIDA